MIVRLGPEAAHRLAAIHATAFETGWSAESIGKLIADGATALATGDAFILTRAVAGEAEILTLAVSPTARCHGLGRALVEAARQAAIMDGAEVLFLEVAADNIAALALYTGCGFAELGRRRGYYARAGGAAVDALIMKLNLSPRA